MAKIKRQDWNSNSFRRILVQEMSTYQFLPAKIEPIYQKLLPVGYTGILYGKLYVHIFHQYRILMIDKIFKSDFILVLPEVKSIITYYEEFNNIVLNNVSFCELRRRSC